MRSSSLGSVAGVQVAKEPHVHVAGHRNNPAAGRAALAAVP